MVQMLGLAYTGNREEGISLMLFKSYKTVTVSKRKPYKFTPRDNVSREAFNYYNAKCRLLGIKVITDPADLLPTSTATARAQKLDAETDQQVDVTKPAEQGSAEGTATQETEEGTLNGEENPTEEQKELGQSSSDTDTTQLTEMSEAELSEYLDMNYDRQGLKDLIYAIGADINIGRKGESALISELVSNHKDAVVAYLSSNK